jgi:YVTN family beta-propeller protein
MVHVYIPNTGDSTVSVIDSASDTVIATTSTSLPCWDAAVSPDGTTALIVDNGGKVSVIDTSSNAVSTTLTVGNSPEAVAFAPDGKTAFVVNTQDSTVSVIDMTTSPPSVKTGTGYPITGFGTDPQGIAVTPDGKTALVANDGSSTVSVIDLTVTPPVLNTGTGYPITVTSTPRGMAISSDGKTALVTNANTTGTVSVIDLTVNPPAAKTGTGYPVSVGNTPVGVAISPDNKTAYVANANANTVSVIDLTATPPVAKTGTGYPISVGSQPNGVAVTSDGKKAYVINHISNNVSVIDLTATPPVVSTTVTVGTAPGALGKFLQPASIPMTTIYTAPQGRLTLTSDTPVMTADATAQTSVYYTPYQGNIVPIYDGANMQSYTFGQLTMALNTTNQTSGNIYDLFVFLNSGVVTIAAGPAWSSASSRGTGAGTTQLQQTDGLWVNANTITLKNGATSYSSIPVGEATYVGSVYMTANGQTGMQFAPTPATGGTNNILGLYNAYNRVRTVSAESDSTSSWTYGTASWRAANASNSNRITYLDGLQQSAITAVYQNILQTSSTAVQAFIGVGVNSTTAPSTTSGACTSTTTMSASGLGYKAPLMGLNYVQALEYSSAATSTYGLGDMALTLTLDM